MGGPIRARVKGGLLEPLEKINLPEGEEVTLTILEAPRRAPNREVFRRAAGGWRGLIDGDKLIRDIYADRLLSTRPEPRL